MSRKTGVFNININDLSFHKKYDHMKSEIRYLLNSNRYAFDSEVLSLFGQYCPNIKSLNITITGEQDFAFFRYYGHKLQELIIDGPEDVVKDYLEFVPNLKKIDNSENNYIETSILLNEDNEFLPKLENIMISLLIQSNNVNKMKILSDKYRQTMKTLNVRFLALEEEELKTCIEYICRFENLKELSLDSFYMRTTEPTDDCLSLIGQKCNKLLKLDLHTNDSLPISDRFFEAFIHFKQVKKLLISIYNNTLMNGSVESFKYCKKLKIYCDELKEEFFTNIATFVPKLRSLRISTEQKFSDSFIDSFHSMKSIEYVELDDRTFKKYWYFGKSLSEVMLSPNGMNVKHITHNCGLIFYR